MTIAVALFDLDGTLVDSLDDLTDAVNHMLAGLDRQPLDASRVRQLVGKGARNLVQRALVSDSVDDISRGLELFTLFNSRHIADKSRLYPGVREMLQLLADNGILMAVISNKPEALSRLILKSLGIDGFFACIAGGDTFPEMKPSPLPLLYVCEKLGYAATAAIMVGDSINDIQAGNLAGISTIGCRWGYGSAGELDSAEFQVDSCADIVSVAREKGATSP